jgi:hypothetical protein
MSLNRGSSMTLKCKGIKRAAPQRVRMPWTEPREPFATCILSRKDKAIIAEGPTFASDSNVAAISRSAMLEPLEGLKAIVAKRKYNTSTGFTLFQLAVHMRHDGRGQRFYRKEWKEGTYDKHVTLASVHFARELTTAGGEAFGYVTFHGETGLFPVEIENANLPGWYVLDYDDARAVPADKIVPAPPSEGTEIPVDTKRFRLRSYPFYDAPNPPAFVNRLLKERGVIPDPPGGAEEGKGAELAEGAAADGSEHRSANA